MARTRTTRSIAKRATDHGSRATALSDPSTIRNEHARPRGGSLRPVAGELPEVVDHRGEPCPVCGVTHRVTMAFGRGEEHSPDNPFAWRIWYKAEYEDGHLDETCAVQSVIVPPAPAGTEAMAIRAIQWLQYRFAQRVHIIGVESPPAAGQAEDLNTVNRELERMRKLDPVEGWATESTEKETANEQ